MIEPKISIVTPCLNGAEYIAECIESVMAEPCTEHVIVDGGSTDGTQEIVHKLQEKYGERIRFSVFQGMGPADAWNIGIEQAKAPILGFLGHDDRLYPGAAKYVTEFFDEEQGLIVYGECEIIDAHGEVLSLYPTEEFNYDRVLNVRNFIACPSCFYKRELFDWFGRIRESGSDYEFWLRVGRHVHFHHIPMVLSQFRMHGNNYSNRNRTETLRRLYGYSREYGGHRLNMLAWLYLESMVSDKIGWSYRWLLRRVYNRVIVKRSIHAKAD